MRTPSSVRSDAPDVWARLAEPFKGSLSPDSAGVDWLAKPEQSVVGAAERVRRRLDATVAGAWELHVELQSAVEASRFVVKARLVILGVAREDFGEGFSLSSASDDAMVKAARRFGIGTESGVVEPFPVATPSGVADVPALTSAEAELAAVFRAEPIKRKQNESRATASVVSHSSARAADTSPGPTRTRTAKPRPEGERRATISADEDFPSCPRCGDIMWDDRGAKKAKDAPDFRCRRRGCVGTLWVDRAATATATTMQAASGDEEFPF